MNVHSVPGACVRRTAFEKDDKRFAVIHAALDLVAEHGFHGAPMAAVADRADVAAGTIYRYFENKDALIVETYRFLEKALNDVITEGYPAEGSVRDRYLHVGRALVRHLIDSPREFRFLEQFRISPYGASRRRELLLEKADRNVVLELFEEGRREGIVKDLPVPVLMALAFGPLMQLCRDATLGLVTLDDRLLAESVEACWDAVRRRDDE